MRTRTVWFSIIIAGALAALEASCGGTTVDPADSTLSSSCSKMCDCSGCNQSARQSCEGSFEAFKKLASDKGCASTFEGYVGCVGAKLQCANDTIDVSACKADADALETCAGAPPEWLEANVCQQYRTEAFKCCDALPDGAAKQTCHKNVDAVVEAANQDACQAGLDAAKVACK